ncbi:MAG: hypothetical protein WC326_05405 [Candidatus Delongbacteria bacterium]
MTGIQGTTPDGRAAWLLSLRRREWVVVDPATHQSLRRERHRWWIKGLLILLLLAVLNGLLDWLTDWHTLPWGALLLTQLHLLQEDRQWRRRLAAAGELRQGGVRLRNVPREGFWLVLSFVPALLAAPVVLFNWRIAHMSPTSFLYLMLLCWLLIAAQIHQVRAVRSLEGEADPAE